MTEQDKIRAEFEKWAKAHGVQLTLDIGLKEYHYPQAKASWAAWQVARALPAAAAPSGWLPIESAPKDGSDILLFGGGVVYIGSWADVLNEFLSQVLDWHPPGCPAEDEPIPTHWAPLPAAPDA